MSDRIQADGCNGPFGDARDCPVHGPHMALAEPDPRDAELARLKAENERLNARDSLDALERKVADLVVENERLRQMGKLDAERAERLTRELDIAKLSFQERAGVASLLDHRLAAAEQPSASLRASLPARDD